MPAGPESGTPSPSAGVAPAPLPEHLARCKGRTVLVVDDNEQNLELLVAYLEDVGCLVTGARDGFQALQHIADNRPELVLLDVMMPRMSGFQACKKLKADPLTRSIPVVMVSALSEVSDREKAADSGADAYLTKPVNRAELVATMAAVLNLADAR